MPSTYTTNLGIEKIATGEQSGTWGTTTNTNFDLIDTAVNGIVSITLASAGTSGSPNDLPITDGTASNGRNKFIEFVDGGDLGATAYVQLTPNDAEKIVHIRNSLSGSRSIIVFQGTYNASNDFEIANGADVTLKFDGGGTGATVTDVNVDLTVTGVTATTADINGGTIDGTTIGGSSAAAGTFTTFTSTGIDDNATSTAITIDSSENVGIGTTSPAYKLDINSGADEEVARFQNTAGFADIFLQDTDTTAGQVRIRCDNNSLSFITGTNIRQTIDSSGNVGIGTTSPVNTASYGGATINGTTGGIFSLAHGDTENTRLLGTAARTRLSAISGPLEFSVGGVANTKMTIDSSGNVGIGTTSPDSNLHLAGSAAASLRFERNDTTIATGNAIGQIHFEHQETGYAGICATLRVESGNNNGNGEFVFQNGVAGTLTEKMRIDRNGKVGIGTTDPARILELAGNNNAGAKANYLRITDTDTTATASNQQGGIEFYASDSSGGAGVTASMEVVYAGSGGGGEITFNTAVNSGAGVAEAMRIDESGNVGIGATSLSNKLTVNGNQVMLANGELKFADAGNSYVSTIKNSGSSGTSQLEFLTGATPTERMRIDASGDVSIGTDSCDFQSANRTILQVEGTTDSILNLSDGTSHFYLHQRGAGVDIWSNANYEMRFGTNNSESMRIDSSGNLLVGATSNDASLAKLYIKDSGYVAINAYRQATVVTYAIQLWKSNHGSTGAVVARCNVDGDFENTNNSYGALSDERLKSNIVDASSQIDDIMAVRVRNYTLNATGDTHIGVVAQELEASGMSGLVQENEEGMKSVKYSILYVKAIKALQEAVTRIETLEAEVAALKGA